MLLDVSMPRYFFDLEDGTNLRDDEGVDCATDNEVRKAAMEVLPAIAHDEILDDGQRRTFTVSVRDEDARIVYVATLTFTGMWLKRDRS